MILTLENSRLLKTMTLKRNFLLLAMIVGFAGVALGIFTMFLTINDILNP